MSRGFTGSDAPDAPPVVAPRAPLPAGVPNYVTPRGLALLRAERDALAAERTRVEADRSDDDERSRRLSTLNQQLAALAPRLSAARLVPVPADPPPEARFGATVAVVPVGSGGEEGPERRVTIVGADEADASEGRIVFVSPLARALTGRRAGETVRVETGLGPERLRIVSVAYDAATDESDDDEGSGVDASA